MEPSIATKRPLPNGADSSNRTLRSFSGSIHSRATFTENLRAVDQLELVNQKNKRRSRLVKIFPKSALCLRLASALPTEDTEICPNSGCLTFTWENDRNQLRLITIIFIFRETTLVPSKIIFKGNALLHHCEEYGSLGLELLLEAHFRAEAPALQASPDKERGRL